MPPKKTKETETSSSSQEHQELPQSNLEAREGRKLNEISRKLSLILSAIETLAETIKENKVGNSTEQNNSISPALSEMTQVLTNISKNIPNNNSDVQIQEEPIASTLIESEALKIKTQISKSWNFKLQKRIEAFWSKTRSEGLKDTYSKWNNEEIPILPKHVQKKFIRNEPELQRKLREKAVQKDFEMEIELQGLRAEQHYERFNNIDKDMKNIIEERSRGSVRKLLLEWWQHQTDHNENISKRRWQRNKQWLQQYESNFLRNFQNKSPYFKIDTEADTTEPKERRQTEYQRNNRNTRERTQVPHQSNRNPRPYPRGKASRARSPQPNTNTTNRFSPLIDVDEMEEPENDHFLEETASTETLV